MPYIGQSPATGEANSFKILDNISSYTLTFDGSGADVVSLANDTITEREHRFVTGQRVTYNDGGGTAITGLSDGVYYIIVEDRNTFKLASSANNAAAGTAINLTGLGAGVSHTLNVAFDGVNTKFKATHTNGNKADISQSGQLMISINGVLQQPHDNTDSPPTGYATDHTSTIIFSGAPVGGDEFFGRLIAENFATFDISDNVVDNFTGDGSTSTFTLSKSPPNNESVLVTIDGIVQYPDDNAAVRAYTVSENTLDFASAPGDGVEIQVRHIGFAGASTGGVSGFYGRTGNAVLRSTDNIVFNDATASGTVQAANVTVTGDLTVNGTTTTLDTDLIGVDKLEVAANNTTVAAAITQTGAGDILNLYDGSTEVFSVADGGGVTITDSIIHSGDTNTKIRFPADDTITAETNGAERLRITSGGLVGIGTAVAQVSSAERLSVFQGLTVLRYDSATVGSLYLRNGNFSSTTNPYLILQDTSGNRGAIGIHNDESAMYIHGQNGIRFRYGGAQPGTNEAMRITDAGNVGIGITSPAAKLHVSGGDLYVNSLDNSEVDIKLGIHATHANFGLIKNVRASDTQNYLSFNIHQSINGTGLYEALQIHYDEGLYVRGDKDYSTTAYTGNVSHVLFGDQGGQFADIVVESESASSRLGAFVFKTKGSSGIFPRERLRIDSNGKLLHTRTDNTTRYDLEFRNTGGISDGNYSGIHWTQGSTGSTHLGAIEIAYADTGRPDIVFKTRQSGGTAISEAVRITSTGLVGIGTDNPLELLHLQSGWTKQILKSTNLNTASSLIFDTHNINTADFLLGQLAGRWNGNDVAYINFEAGADTTNKDDGVITFLTSASGSTPTEKLRITSDGNVGIGYVSPRTPLEINGTHDTTNDTVTPVLRLSTGNSYAGSNTGSALEFGTTNTTYPTWVKGRIGCVYNGSSNYGGHLVFQTNTGSGPTVISEKMRITDAGDMGLGTASPRSITNFGSFAINGTAGAFTDYFLNGTRTGTTAVDSNGFTSEAVGSSTPFRVITNGSERLRIDSNGKLHVGGNGTGTDVVNIIGYGSGINISRVNSGTAAVNEWLGALGFKGYASGNSSSGADARIHAVAAYNHSGSSAPADLIFSTKPTTTGPGSAPTERLRITNAGYIGINEDIPIAQLTVNYTGTQTTSSYNTATHLRIDGTSGSNTMSGIGFGFSNSGGQNYLPSAWMGIKVASWTQYVTHDLVFATRGTDANVEPTERLRIKSDGKILGSGTAVFGNTGAAFSNYVPLVSIPNQGSTGCYVGKSSNYTTAYSLLPWSGGGTYISSGIYYDNGTWVHQSSNNNNCLFYLTGGGWYWYASNNGTSSWNLASNVNIMSSAGVWVGGTSSDRRLKENITNMSSSDALTKVTQLQGVSYTWKDEVRKKYGAGPYPEGIHHGFIAQDVKTVWPDAHIISDIDNESDFDNDPTKDIKDDVYYGEIEGVKMEKMIPLLLEAIKELNTKNKALEERIAALE